MDSKVSKSGNFERTIEVSVPESELAPHFDSALENYRKNLKLEGFRKGKVPMGLVKKLYGDAIKGQALDDVIQSVFQEVKQKEKLRPVGPAKLDDIDYKPETGLKFKAKVEVVPDIELKKYTGLSVEKEVYQVDEQDITNALEDVRERNAVMEPVEDEAEQDHYILADLQKVDVNGVPLIGQKFEDRWIHLNADEKNDFTPQLIGVKTGDTRRVELTPYDPQAQNGKDIFDVTIKEIKLKKLPELDDELAKDTGDFETLDDLKKDIREKLEAQSESIAKRGLRQKLIDELIKKNDFDLPETMITNYLEMIVENAKQQHQQQYGHEHHQDDESLKSEYRPMAIRTIKWELSKDKLVEMENIEVDDADRERYIEQMSQNQNVDVKEIKKALRDKSTARRVDEDLLEEKVLEYLETNAKIKEKKLTRKDLEKQKK